MLSVKIEESYLLRKTVIAAAVMFSVVGGVAGGIGSSNLDAAGPAEGLLVQDDGGWGSGGSYCTEEFWTYYDGSVLVVKLSCNDGSGYTTFYGA